MLLNHGVVTLGNTPDEALFYLNNLVNACEFQVHFCLPVNTFYDSYTCYFCTIFRLML
jgi:hypothetical protein